jgi:hypothetical protein
MAVEMINKIKQCSLNIRILLVGDAAYAKKKLLRGCIKNNISFISRLRSDAALYTPLATVMGKKPRGRPAVKGAKLPALSKLPKSQKLFSKLRLELYGDMKDIEYYEFEAYWKPAGAVIKIIIVKYPQKNRIITSYFFSTDLAISAQRIITLVAARWAIENTFKDLKEHFGLKNWQCRIKKAVERSIPLTCFAYSTILMWGIEQKDTLPPVLANLYPWQRNKITITVSDLITHLKNQSIELSILSLLDKERISDIKIMKIMNIFRAAA